MREPKFKDYKWSVKDSQRDEYVVRAKWRYTEESETEPDYYSSFWVITIKSWPCNEMTGAISFVVETQYDEPPSIAEIGQEFRRHVDRFADSAIAYRKL